MGGYIPSSYYRTVTEMFWRNVVSIFLVFVGSFYTISVRERKLVNGSVNNYIL